MKKFLILIALISTILCTIEDCNSCTNQNLCNDIKVEFEDFYCFKYSHEGASASQGCISFPINKNQNQKSFLNIYNGLVKEINSIYPEEQRGTYYNLRAKKDTYEKTETVVTKIEQFSSDDNTKLNSAQTCSYYFYGRFIKDAGTKEYENITDKNLCYNAKQFDDLKNLIDCGYATISFSLGQKNYAINTCFLMPNDNLPSEFNKYLKYYLFEALNFDSYLSGIASVSEYLETIKKEQELNRQLQALKYNVEVENKNGKKIKYTSDKDGFEVVSSDSGTNSGSSGGNKGSFVNNNFLLLILILFL